MAPDSAYKRRLQSAQIRSYFYGGPSISLGSLSPHSMSIRFDVLSLNRVGDESVVPLSALPVGHTRTIQDTQLVEVDPADGSGEILSNVCALPQTQGNRKRKSKKDVLAEIVKQEDGIQNEAEAPEEQEEVQEERDEDDVEDAMIATSPVLGFVHM